MPPPEGASDKRHPLEMITKCVRNKVRFRECQDLRMACNEGLRKRSAGTSATKEEYRGYSTQASLPEVLEL